MTDAKRDNNYVTTLIGVSSVDGITPVTVYVDPVTHRILVQSASGGGTPGGSTTQLQYNNAGAFGGIVGAITDGTNTLYGSPSTGAIYTSALNFQYDALGATAPTAAQSFVLQNLTAATVGVSQASPAIAFSSNGWSTTSTASQNVTWKIYQAAISGTSPVGSLTFSSSTNGSAYTTKLVMNSSGSMTFTGVVSVVSGNFTQNTSNIGLVSSDGIMTVNSTASSGGTTVQMSPRFRWSGTAWTGAASQVVSFIAEVLPATAATPTGAWNLSASINGAAYNQVFSVDNSGNAAALGNMNIATGKTYQINGTQITSAALSDSASLVTLTGAQTLTNKSLTSVAITGAGAGVATLVYSNSASNGTITIPGTTGSTMVLTTSTQTLSNKRFTRRFVATTQSATPTINTDNTDISSITALAQAITSMTTNLSGTPVAGDYLQIQITDNGTARAITWGASFASTTVTLPTTTVISTLLRIGFQWDTVAAVWQCIAVA